MPSTSGKQARTMAAAAHDPAFAKKLGIPQSVASEFNAADKGSAMLSEAMEREPKGNPDRSGESREHSMMRQRSMSKALRRGGYGG
jgi:hypothetical protein